MANIGSLAVQVTANAQSFTDTMSKVRANASRAAADVAKSMEKAAGASMPKLDASAMAKRLNLGANKLVDVHPGAAASEGQAKALAMRVKSDHAALAKMAAERGKALVKVNEQGKVSVLAYRDGVLKYIAAEKVRGSLSGTIVKDLKAQEEAQKKATAAAAAKGGGGGGGLGKAAAVGIGGAALLGAGVVGGTIATMASGVNDIMKADRQARELGVTVSELRTFMLAAGDAGDVMGQAIGHMGEKFAAARIGQSEAIADLKNLAALSGRKLDLGVLQLPPVEGYKAVVEQLAAIPDATQRAAAAYRQFGGAAAALTPELAKGAAGVERAQQVLKNFGLGIGEKDLANARQVAATMRELGALKSGFVNQVTLGFAPIVAELTKVFDVAKLDISGVQSAVIDMAEKVGQAGAFVVEAWKNPDVIVQAWSLAAGAIKAIFQNLMGELLTATGQALQKMGEQVKLLSMAVGFATGGIGGAISGGNAGGAVADSAGGIAGLGKGMQEDAARNWGKIAKDWEAFNEKLAKAPAFKSVEEFMKRARERTGGKDTTTAAGAAMPAHIAKLHEEAAAAAKSLKDPATAFEDTMKRIEEMDRVGAFKGNEGLKAKMVQQAFGDAVSKLPQAPPPPGAVLKNSREAYSTIETFRRQEGRQDVPGLLQALKDETKARQDAANELLKDILEALKDGKGGGPADDEKVERWKEFF